MLFNGGDLILYPKPGHIKRIKVSKLKYLTAVAFDLSVLHECTPITKDLRVLLNKDLYEK